MALSQFVLGFAPTVYNVNSVGLRLAITPRELQGRVSATMRCVM